MPDLRRLAILAVAIPALTIAACGDDDEEESAAGGAGNGGETRDYNDQAGGDQAGGDQGSAGAKPEKLELTADPGGALEFDETSLRASAGEVTIEMDNPSSIPHAVEIEGQGVEKVGETVGEGGVSTVSAELEPGEYEFYCPVGNHQEAGMEGTLTITE